MYIYTNGVLQPQQTVSKEKIWRRCSLTADVLRNYNYLVNNRFKEYLSFLRILETPLINVYTVYRYNFKKFIVHLSYSYGKGLVAFACPFYTIIKTTK